MNKPLTNKETLLKRLKFRSGHRGWKEMDLILGHFAEEKLESLLPADLAAYEQMLEEDDDVIWAWVIGKNTPPEEFSNIIRMLEGYGRQI